MRPEITDYQFGKIKIGSQIHTTDLKIRCDGAIHENWRRKSGHLLTLDDIRQLIEEQPEWIIAGTGANGRMKISPDLPDTLKEMGISFLALPTAAAAEKYNRMRDTATRLNACFHLTC